MEIINIIQVDDIEMKITEDTTAVKEGKAVWDNAKKMYVMDVNQSPRKACWRCVHKNGEVVALLESEGLTESIWDMFCGSAPDVKAEIDRLKLNMSDHIKKIHDGIKSVSIVEATR